MNRSTRIQLLVLSACIPWLGGMAAAPQVSQGTAEENTVDPLSSSCRILVPDDHESIQAAINAAEEEDCEIIVAPGTYHERINFGCKAIRLKSRSGDPADTIIDGGGQGPVVTCECGQDDRTVLEGFTITGGAGAPWGGGMLNRSSSPTVTNCWFIDNEADNGGGMSNLSSHEGGSSSPTVTNCMFIGNIANLEGGGMNNNGPDGAPTSNPQVVNSLFDGNTAEMNGGGMFNNNGASPNVINCTFSGNSASSGGGMTNGFSSPGLVRITNSILWENTPDQILSGRGGETLVTYSLVEGGRFGEGNTRRNPLFADPGGGDFRLSAGSPAIDAGDNTAVPLDVADDLDLNPRFMDDPDSEDPGNGACSIVDIGAYEFEGQCPRLHVPGDFAAIQSAIDAACDDCPEIIVAPGTYLERINFGGKAIRLKSRSGDPADTIIDGEGEGTVVTCETGEEEGTVLEGFTITHGGNAARGGGMVNRSSSPTVTNCWFIDNEADNGGGMSNRSSHEGGSSSPTVTNCMFLRNIANLEGGGMNNNGPDGAPTSNPEVVNCFFDRNTAEMNGGGMFNNNGASPDVVNCTFSGNSASSGGGVLSGFSTAGLVEITNCILWANTPDQIVGGVKSGETVVTYSCVEGGWSGEGEGNTEDDPLFVHPDDGNFRLSAGSPAIDAGDNTAVPDGIELDLDGNPRLVDDLATEDGGRCGDPCDRPIVDMGAYEFQAGLLLPDRVMVLQGQRVAGGIADLMFRDDYRMVTQARRPSAVSEPSVQVMVEGFAVNRNPTSLVFSFESSAIVRVPQWADFYDFDHDGWVRVDTRPSSTEDTLILVRESDNPARFIHPDSGLIRTRLSWYDPGISFVGWSAAIDYAVWMLEGQ